MSSPANGKANSLAMPASIRKVSRQGEEYRARQAASGLLRRDAAGKQATAGRKPTIFVTSRKKVFDITAPKTAESGEERQHPPEGKGSERLPRVQTAIGPARETRISSEKR